MSISYNLESLLKNRHFKVVSDYLTVKKVYNAAMGFIFYTLGVYKYTSQPFVAKIETTDLCNLQCPMCHDGSMPRKNILLDYSLFKKAIDETKDYLLEVILYHQGEPLLDPKIIDYIKYAKMQNIGTVISSNLSMNLTQAKIEELVSSGLDYLIVAIDGVTNESQTQKRIGSKLSKIIFNLSRIIAAKETLGLSKPYIEWQMIDFDFNKNEQESARKLAEEIGVNAFNIKPSWENTLFSDTSYGRNKRCPLQWFSYTLLCDGKINACHNDVEIVMGESSSDDIVDVWHSSKYKDLRKTHRTNKNYACSTCHLYDKK